MRCEEFYEKWKKAGNFCEKHPKTASRIEKFLDQIVVELDEELAKSEIFQGGNGPNGPVISEGASRPLISETDPDVRYEAIHQIVKVAEEKHMDGHPVKVIGREVEEILETAKAKKNGAHVVATCGHVSGSHLQSYPDHQKRHPRERHERSEREKVPHHAATA